MHTRTRTHKHIHTQSDAERTRATTYAVRDKRVELAKRALVEEQIDALARSQLAFVVLFCQTRFACNALSALVPHTRQRTEREHQQKLSKSDSKIENTKKKKKKKKKSKKKKIVWPCVGLRRRQEQRTAASERANALTATNKRLFACHTNFRFDLGLLLDERHIGASATRQRQWRAASSATCEKHCAMREQQQNNTGQTEGMQRCADTKTGESNVTGACAGVSGRSCFDRARTSPNRNNQ